MNALQVLAAKKLKLMIKRILLILLLSAVALFSFPVLASAQSPHGNYMSSSSLCGVCHDTHTPSAPGSQRSERLVKSGIYTYKFKKVMLLRNADEKALCYTCHNGTGSVSDIARQFGETSSSSPPVSKHPVPQGTILCTDCHSPHLSMDDLDGDPEPYEVVRLLRSIYSSFMGFVVAQTNNWLDVPKAPDTLMGIPEWRKLTEPYEQCGSCHGAGSTLPGGNVLEYYDSGGAKHDGTDSVSPESKAGIACLTCHEWHASSLPKLLETTISGISITDNDNQVCYSCHKIISIEIASFDLTTSGDVHGATDSTNTSGSPPGFTGPYYYRMAQIRCVVCHGPHGTQNIFWVQPSINGTSGLSVDATSAAARPKWEGMCGSCHIYTHDTTATYDLCGSCHFHGAGNDTSATTKF